MKSETSSRRRIVQQLVFVQRFVSVIMIISLVLLVFFQVILRAFNFPLMGIEELIIFPTIWLYMLGAANASQERSHISVDILEVFLTNKTVLTIMDVLKNIFSLLIGTILLFWLFRHFSYSLSAWKLGPLISMPMFFAESAVFVGVLLMTLYTVSDVFRSLKNAKKYLSESKGGL